ncbi:unnamed protein product, partial [marine sediment metagenome]
ITETNTKYYQKGLKADASTSLTFIDDTGISLAQGMNDPPKLAKVKIIDGDPDLSLTWNGTAYEFTNGSTCLSFAGEDFCDEIMEVRYVQQGEMLIEREGGTVTDFNGSKDVYAIVFRVHFSGLGGLPPGQLKATLYLSEDSASSARDFLESAIEQQPAVDDIEIYAIVKVFEKPTEEHGDFHPLSNFNIPNTLDSTKNVTKVATDDDLSLV